MTASHDLKLAILRAMVACGVVDVGPHNVDRVFAALLRDPWFESHIADRCRAHGYVPTETRCHADG